LAWYVALTVAWAVPVGGALPALAQDAQDSSGPVAARPPAPPDRLPSGITPKTVEAIDRGLSYLARMQDRQGAWANQGGYGGYPVAMTALAGLALMMDGNTTTQGHYAINVDRAARYIVRSATGTGAR